jgi:hypothetical protein
MCAVLAMIRTDRGEGVETGVTKIARTIGIVILAALVVAIAAYGIANLSRASVMTGVIVRAGGASVVSHDQLGTNDHIVVNSVTAPDASWLVAYRAGMGGMAGAFLGYVHVPAGTTHDVNIPIDVSIRLTPLAIITLNADRGIAGRFEFDASRFDASPDKPYYIAGRAVQTTVTVALPEMENSFDLNLPDQTP